MRTGFTAEVLFRCPVCSLWLLSAVISADHAGWNAHGNCVGRHIARDDGVGTDDGIIVDTDALQNRGLCSYSYSCRQ